MRGRVVHQAAVHLVAVVLALLISLFAGLGTLQYADVRSAYPPHMTGRAMAVFTMAMFLGVAAIIYLWSMQLKLAEEA